MKEEFIIILQENRNLGWIFLPFIVTRNDSQDFSTPKEFISPTQLTENFEEHQKQLVKIIHEYDEKKLTKLFSKKKKLTPRDFIDTLPEELLEKHIRPFIEKQMSKCIDIIRKHSISIYYKKAKSNLYPEDEIKVEQCIPSTTFNFEKHSSGLQYNLSINVNDQETTLQDKEFILISNEPCHIIIENVLYSFSDINGKKLLPFFKKPFIAIPEKLEIQYFETFILNSIKNYRVNAQGFEIKCYNVTPKVKLSIVNNLQQTPSLLLEFLYGNTTVNFKRKGKILVNYYNDGDNPFYTKFERDLEFEEHIVNSFLEKGLKISTDNLLVPKVNHTDSNEQYNSILQWIPKNRAFLSEHNILVKNIDDKVFQTAQCDLDISVKSFNDDWFDINAIVYFGEFQIPFKRLRNHIIKREPLIKLPNGELAIIPEEWFARYKDIFLFDTESESNESIKLNKLHYKILDNSIEKPSKQLKNKLKELNTFQNYNAELPVHLNAQLRSYQKTGYNWLYFLKENRLGGCLADDMGLGKTLQTLTLLQKTIEDYKPNGKANNIKPEGQLSLFDFNANTNGVKAPASLIVMPASLVHNWFNEIRKFTPKLKVYRYIGNVRNKGLHYFNKYDIVLTTYGLLRNDIDSFENYKFHYIILDESQVIKNPGSKIYNAVLRLSSDYKLVLTGTPIENSLTDLWAQMNFLNRNMLGNLTFFKNEFIKKIDRNDEDPKKRLQKIIKPFILRREKKEVAKDLPDLTEQVRICKMDDEQEKYYESEKSKIRNLIYESIEKNGINKSSIHILQGLTKLRQIANHPAMIEGSNVLTSGKYEEVLRIMESLIEDKTHKILLFSSFVKQLSIFEASLKEMNIKYSLLTGETSNREKVISEFQNDPENKVFLISIKAGGVGLNLTEADYVFILDPWWNPAIESQAVSRAHRIGQKNKVFVYRFISENTIEEKIRKLQEKKEELAKAFINSDNNFDFSQDNVDYLFD